MLSVSPVVGIGTPQSPTPLAAGECAPHPLVRGGGHTRLRLKGWGSPNSNEGTYTVVLYIYKYFVMTPKGVRSVLSLYPKLHTANFTIKLPQRTRQSKDATLFLSSESIACPFYPSVSAVTVASYSPYSLFAQFTKAWSIHCGI